MKPASALFSTIQRRIPEVLTYLALTLVLASPAQATTEITLKNEFIEKYKNRATIEVDFLIVHAKDRPNSPSQDGDLHIAGLADEIDLAVVAEIMNAHDEHEARDLVKEFDGSGETIKMVGAWRIWTEHGGDSEQVQGADIPEIVNSNPDHVFEIHPVTRIGEEGLEGTFRDIEGYDYKNAESAFRRYEVTKSELECGEDTTTIRTNMAGFNYPHFLIRLLEDPTHEVKDGLTVFASVHDPITEELLVTKRRMVFVKGTEPFDDVKERGEGDEMDVLGASQESAWRSCPGGASMRKNGRRC